MNKYDRLKFELELNGIGKMKGFGNSMLPILQSGSTLTYVKCDSPDIGDIVFCKVKGRWIDAHKVTAKSQDGQFMISNNHGHDNGWTRQVYGRVIHEHRAGGYQSKDFESWKDKILVN